jgi:hypothetical protein
MRRLGLALVALAVATSCDRAPARSAATTAQTRQAMCGQATDATIAVYNGLSPVCAGCHVSGTRAFFVSISTFQSLLVSDPRLVAPGDPDNSELVRLLEGMGTGAFKQMPIGTQTYTDLLNAGTATLSIQAVRDWITGLAQQARDTRPDPSAMRMTRMTAERVQRALYQQLGLAHSDFFSAGSNYGIAMANPITDDDYPMQGPDAFPPPFTVEPSDRFYGLGGGSVTQGQKKDLTPSPTFVLTLTQVSQRWCRMALNKTGNTALFPAGTTNATDDANVKATLARWFLHFHGTKASQAEIDELFDTVWTPLASQGGDVPWTGLCSAFIRHPDWIFY